MKTTITLGAGLLVLSATLILRNANTDSTHAAKNTLPPIETEQPMKETPARRANSHKIVSAPQHPNTSVEILKAIETETDPDHRSELLERAVETVAHSELPGLLQTLVRLESPVAIEMREQLIRRWAETDGPAAAAWAVASVSSAAGQVSGPDTSHPAPDTLTHLAPDTLTQVALGWAATDQPAALAWAQTLPAGESRAAVTLNLGYEIARTDAVQAIEVAATLEPTRQRDDLIEHAIRQWAVTDFATAVQWAEGNVSDPNLRQRLLAAMAVAVAGQDGAAAATLAATALTPGAEQDRVAVAIVQRWVQNQPEQAAAWVTQFPDTPARETTAQNLVAFWAAQDGEATASWLQTLPEGTLRTAGMTAYAQVQSISQ